MDAPAQYRADIDGLRAIAVVLVLGFHAFPGRVPGGFVGVDVFFVISGYLITGLILRELQQDRFSVARFYARRIRRIFPALAVLLVACLAAAAPLLGPSAYAQLGLHAAAGAAFVANLVLWAQSGYFAAGSDSLPLLHLWSLGVEEQFYLAWPLTLAVLFRRTRRLWVPLALIAAASLALNLYQVRASPDTAFYSPLTRFWELMTGALLAVGAERRLAPALRAAMSLGGVALVLVAALAFDGSQEFPGWRAVVPVSGTALSIAAGSEAWLNRRLLSLRAPVFVGLISYPLYLWHWPALSLLPLLDVAWTQRQELLLKLAALALASLLAWLTYRFVERPVRFEKKGSTAALCAAMAVPLVAGLLVAGAGYRARQPVTPRQRELAAWMEDVQRRRPDLYRDRRCALAEDQDETQLASECFPPAGTPTGSATLLWGDSHAVQLAPGLRARGDAAALAQITATSCPPIVGYAARGRPHCGSLNRFVLDWVKSHRPRTVLLAASWPSYDGYRAVAGTIATLAALGTPRVVVVGPFPSFRERVFDLLLRDGGDSRLPERLKTPRLERLRAVDRELRALAASAGAEYASPLDLLCDERGCLVAPGGETAGILVFDQSHLTPAGSSYVAERLLEPHLR
jgi:peptidoglycan/LPS O-acetylase OafA/YrhL